MAVIVELYSPGADAPRRAARAADAIRGACDAATRHLASIVVPDDETCFLLFDGDVDDVRRASERAGVGATRVARAITTRSPAGKDTP